MTKIHPTPENAEGCLFHARARVAALGNRKRNTARLHGRRLLDGLFYLVGNQLPLSDGEMSDLAAWHWVAADGDDATTLRRRLKRAILNVGVARLVASLAQKWSAKGRSRTRFPVTTKVHRITRPAYSISA